MSCEIYYCDIVVILSLVQLSIQTFGYIAWVCIGSIYNHHRMLELVHAKVCDVTQVLTRIYNHSKYLSGIIVYSILEVNVLRTITFGLDGRLDLSDCFWDPCHDFICSLPLDVPLLFLHTKYTKCSCSKEKMIELRSN